MYPLRRGSEGLRGIVAKLDFIRQPGIFWFPRATLGHDRPLRGYDNRLSRFRENRRRRAVFDGFIAPLGREVGRMTEFVETFPVNDPFLGRTKLAVRFPVLYKLVIEHDRMACLLLLRVCLLLLVQFVEKVGKAVCLRLGEVILLTEI